MIEIAVILVILAILILPVKLAANYVGAQNTGVFYCIAALILAAAIQDVVRILLLGVMLDYSVLGHLVSILLSAFAYMLVLGTSYGKGIVIAILQVILTVLLIFVLGLLGLGISGFM